MTAPKGRGVKGERGGGRGPGGARQTEFDAEVREAVRYEKGLAVKALIALALVAAVVLARLLYLA